MDGKMCRSMLLYTENIINFASDNYKMVSINEVIKKVLTKVGQNFLHI